MNPVVFCDNDGFLALCDVEAYEGYVGEDWNLEQLTEVFNAKLTDGSLAVMYLGPDPVSGQFTLRDHPSEQAATWEQPLRVRVTSGHLHLVTFTALTMVAQFADEKLAGQDYEMEAVGEAEPGEYTVTIRQFASPAGVHSDPDTWPRYELVLTSGFCPTLAEFPGMQRLVEEKADLTELSPGLGRAGSPSAE